MDFQPLLNTHHDDRGQDVCEKVFESPGLQNSGSSLNKAPSGLDQSIFSIKKNR